MQIAEATTEAEHNGIINNISTVAYDIFRREKKAITYSSWSKYNMRSRLFYFTAE